MLINIHLTTCTNNVRRGGPWSELVWGPDPSKERNGHIRGERMRTITGSMPGRDIGGGNSPPQLDVDGRGRWPSCCSWS